MAGVLFTYVLYSGAHTGARTEVLYVVRILLCENASRRPSHQFLFSAASLAPLQPLFLACPTTALVILTGAGKKASTSVALSTRIKYSSSGARRQNIEPSRVPTGLIWWWMACHQSHCVSKEARAPQKWYFNITRSSMLKKRVEKVANAVGGECLLAEGSRPWKRLTGKRMVKKIINGVSSARRQLAGP